MYHHISIVSIYMFTCLYIICISWYVPFPNIEGFQDSLCVFLRNILLLVTISRAAGILEYYSMMYLAYRIKQDRNSGL